METETFAYVSLIYGVQKKYVMGALALGFSLEANDSTKHTF